jgi:uncharacterized protein (TIGR00369 family)
MSSPDVRERVRASFARQGFMRALGAELGTVERGTCEIRLPFRESLTQQDGYFHAGAIGAIADTAGGYAAYTLMDAADNVLSVEYKLNLLAPGRGEALRARARVLRAGRTLTVCRIDVSAVREGQETLCATALQTLIRGRSAGPGAIPADPEGSPPP